MSDRANNSHGGPGRGQGRHRKASFEIAADPQTPMEWLWKRLTERYGKTTIDEIHQEYNQVVQVYQKSRIAQNRARREQERAALRDEQS